ncbi:hypothetical protein GCM10010211_21940 [Streptomyces albospinus]|uniref:Uncharacterized protein n=1 Tax=Streptomyces albospinus TaxID=285515 RepID=A0ABQ2UXC0_9ACTN|nr:hypothetical protein GCM10010211_21940 [Streptomyces albospinus]
MQGHGVEAGVTGGGKAGGAVVAAFGGVAGLGEVADDEVRETGLVIDDQAVRAGQAVRACPQLRGR